MRKLILLGASLSAIAFIVVTPAQAANTRSFVASNGSDSNACTQAAPCLTFAQALTQTSVGGEIDCLTGGDYGPITITASITIDCAPGNVGGIDVGANSNAISINLSAAGVVNLRNLSLNGFGASNNVGISTISNGFPNGSQLYVQHLSIQGMSVAIFFAPTGARGLIELSDAAINNNGAGINVSLNSGSIASVVFDGVKIAGTLADGWTISGPGTIAGVLRDSVVAESNGNGVVANVSGSVFLTVEESSIVDNVAKGITAIGAGVNLEVGGSTISGNGTGVSAAAGSIFSFGNNQLSANGADGAFTPGGPRLQ
jgi:hypothetical protein